MNAQTIFAALVATVLCTASAQAQSASLFHQDLPQPNRPVLKLPETSFYYQEVEPPKEIEKYDQITILVQQKSRTTSEGDLERRKNSFFDATIGDWLEFDNGLDLQPAPQADGDPRINARLNSQYRTEAELETSDSLTFQITAQVVDVRPNGSLVLEGRSQIRVNEETWEYAIAGVARREDVLPNNTILSEKLAELSIYKRERGSVFDGYRRGWALRLYDRFQPF